MFVIVYDLYRHDKMFKRHVCNYSSYRADKIGPIYGSIYMSVLEGTMSGNVQAVMSIITCRLKLRFNAIYVMRLSHSEAVVRHS